MSNMPVQDVQTRPSDDTEKTSPALIGAAIGVAVVTLVLIVGAVLLAINADTAGPTVQVIRDIFIILLALELFAIGAAVTVFIVQIARFISLMNNELEPIIAGTQETVQVVRGTAQFLSRHLTAPVIKAAGAVGGIARVVNNLSAINKQTGGVIYSAYADGTTPVDDEFVAQRDTPQDDDSNL